MKATTTELQTAAARLRALADWLERHEVTDDELTAATTWGCCRNNDVQLHLDAARRLWPGKTLVVNDAGFAHLDDDGICVAIQCTATSYPREVTL